MKSINPLHVALFIMSLCACSFSGGNEKVTTEQDVVSISIGKVILLNDSLLRYERSENNSFGATEAFLLFKNEYEKKIRALSINYRVDYFLSIMWHLSLDGGYMGEFQEIVLADCGDVFIKRLEEYVNKEREMKRSKAKLYLSERVLADLLAMKAFEL